MKKQLLITAELVEALTEIGPPTITWQDTAEALLRGCVAEFWQNASTGSGLTLNGYRERTRAFVREGDTFTEALRKAKA